MRIVFLGDIYAQSGIEAVRRFLPRIKKDYPHDIIIANGENVAGGLGITKMDYKALMQLGIKGITLGNHAFSKGELFEFIDDANIVRAINYPAGTPGKTVLTINFNGTRVAIIQVMGRIFMGDPLNNPFEALDAILPTIDSDYVVVDVHAEATSEKLAIGYYLDGRVDAVVGTHTHVPTNDAMRLPAGTLYQTDAGMCGVKHGILGASRETVLKKFTTGMPVRLKPEESSILQLNGVVLDLKQSTIQTIRYTDE